MVSDPQPGPDAERSGFGAGTQKKRSPKGSLLSRRRPGAALNYSPSVSGAGISLILNPSPSQETQWYRMPSLLPLKADFSEAP